MVEPAPAEEKNAKTFEKLEALRSVIRDMGSALVCYSGGVDSAFVLAVAHEVLGKSAIGMTAVSPSLASFERTLAIDVAAQIGAHHELVDSHEIDDENYQANNVDRCFHCKSELYRLSAKKRVEWNLAEVLNGTNLDDLGDYRPGLEAAKAAGARSPLVETGFTKSDVRAAAKLIGLGVWDKPASACLSSRLPYGTRVTRERLTQIGALEETLHQLGLRQVRVRWHALGQTAGTNEGAIARIEVAREEFPLALERANDIVAGGKAAGFMYITLDLGGYRKGSHNEVLDARPARRLPVLG